MATQEDDDDNATRAKNKNGDVDEGSVHETPVGRSLLVPQMRKRKSDTAWESSIAKKRRGIVKSDSDLF